MAWALVKWTEEKELTVIPSSWVVQPNPLPSLDLLPKEVTCIWKKKSNRYHAMLLAVSGQ